jgi:hypothetical protein
MRTHHCENPNNPNNPAAGISGGVCVNHLWPVVAGGGVMKDEVLKLALEALETELAVDMTNGAEVGEAAELMCEAITAIKQTLANAALDKKAENARELGLDYEPNKGLSEHIAQATNSRVRIDPVTGNVGIGTPAAQPAVPDAITDNSESLEYIQGWNDCRAEMLRMNNG